MGSGAGGLLLFSQARIRQTEGMVMMPQARSTNLDFMIPGAGIYALGCYRVGDIVKMRCFYRDLLLYSQARIGRDEGTVMMSVEGSARFVYFMALGAWPDSHIMNALCLCGSSLRSGMDRAKREYSKDGQGGVCRNFRFHAPGAGVVVLGCGHIVNMKYVFPSSYLHWGMDRTGLV